MNRFLTSIDDINHEILLNVVDDEDLLNMCNTNKYASELLKNDDFWKQRIQRIYGYDFSKYFDNITTYRQIYDELRRSDGDLKQILVTSARRGYLPLVRFIIERGDNGWINNSICVERNIYDFKWIDYLTHIGRAIYAASSPGHINILKYLLQDSKIIIVDYYKHYDKAIYLATLNEHLTLVRYLTEELVPTRISGDEELEAAVENEHLEMVVYLVEHFEYNRWEKSRSLRIAAEKGNIEIVQHLIEVAGADPHIHGDSAFYEAVEGNNLTTLKYMIEVAGDVDFDALLETARKKEHTEMIEYLESK